MAIQSRHGTYSNFDPDKLIPGEWAVVLSGDPNSEDGASVYVCFSAGKVKRMATYEDMVENINEITEDIQAQLTEGVEAAINAANSAASSANEVSEQIEQNAASGTYSASVEIGSVTTGDPGSQASVTNSGTEKDVILDFVIPQGTQGPIGPTGTIENLPTATVEFTEASEKENIQSGDTVAVMFGKIQKYFTDLDTYWPRLNQIQQVDISEVFSNISNTTGITIEGKLTIITFGINFSPYSIKLVCMEVSVTAQNKAVPNLTSLGNVTSEYSGIFGQNGSAVMPPIDCKYIDGYGTSEIGARIGVYPYSSGFYGAMYNVDSSASGTKKYIGSATWIAAF